MAAQSCLSYLTYQKHPLNDRTWLGSVGEQTFRNYAFMWWGYHFERAFNAEQRMSDQAREQLQEFLGTSTKPGKYYCKWLENVAALCAGFGSWSRLNTEYYYLRSIPPNPLFAMSFYNFGGELEQHWELDVFNPNCKNHAREPLLQVAIVRGNQWAVEYLCSKGADVNAIINRRSLLMLAIDSDRGAAVCSLLDRGAKLAAIDEVYPTLLHAAASRGGVGVMEAALAQGADISETVILAAAENRYRGAEIMKLLLARDTEIQPTEAVVVAVMENWESGPELIELLFARNPSLQVPDAGVVAALSRDSIRVVEVFLDRIPDISEAVLVAVAKRPGGPKLIRKLLSTSDDEIQITGAVVAAVMEHWRSGHELMELLFDRNPSLQVSDAAVVAALSRDNIKVVEVFLDRSHYISEAVLVAVARIPDGPRLITKLLSTSDAEIQITEAVVTAAMEHRESSPELMGLLFDRNPSLQVSDAAVVAAAESSHGLQLIQPLLARGAIPITQSLLIAASSVQEYDPTLMRLLLAGDRNIEITEEVLVAAVSNRWDDEEIVALLLARNPDLRITGVILAAAASESRARIVDLLLARSPEIAITEAILAGAVSNWSGVAVVELLLARNPDIEITEAVLMAAVSDTRSGTEIVELLLAKGPGIEITEAILTAAASNTNFGAEILALLLPRNPDIEIIEEILTAAVSNLGSGAEVVELIFARSPDMKITEAAETAAAACEWNGRLIRALSASHSVEAKFPSVMAVEDLGGDKEFLARYPNIPISETELVAAAKSIRHPELIVGLLLDRDPTLKVTEAVVIAALESHYCHVELMELLLARGAAELRISQAIVAAAEGCLRMYQGWGIIELLLKHSGIQLPRKTILHALSGNRREGLLQLLLNANSEIEITSALLEATKTARGSELVEVLLAVGVTTKITEEVLVAAAANETKRGGRPGVAVALMELFLARNPSLQITEAVMIAAAGNSRAVEVLKDLCARDNSLRVTESVVAAAAANTSCGLEVIRLLVARDGSLEVTERIMVAAAANGDCGLQVMEILLTRDVVIKVTEEVMVVAAANDDCRQVIKLLLSRDENIEVTERILMASIRDPDVMELLFAYDATAETTDALVMAAARSGTGRTMACLLDRNPGIGCTDAIVKALAENPVRNRSTRHEIMRMFLRRDKARGTGKSNIQL